MKILDEKKTKAIITLDFGVLVTKSFRILESPYENMNNEKLWLIPPLLTQAVDDIIQSFSCQTKIFGWN